MIRVLAVDDHPLFRGGIQLGQGHGWRMPLKDTARASWYYFT